MGNVRFNSHREMDRLRQQPHGGLLERATPQIDRLLLADEGLDGQFSMSFVYGRVWFLALPRPTRLKMLTVITSHAAADLRRHDINTAGKRHHRFSGLVQRDINPIRKMRLPNNAYQYFAM